jgi:hypothetical protein
VEGATAVRDLPLSLAGCGGFFPRDVSRTPILNERLKPRHVQVIHHGQVPSTMKDAEISEEEEQIHCIHPAKSTQLTKGLYSDSPSPMIGGPMGNYFSKGTGRRS